MSHVAKKDQFAEESLGLAGLSLKLAVKSAFSEIKPQLDEVERRVYTHLDSDATQLTEIAEYLVQLGGKRIRPLLALLSGKLFCMNEPSDALLNTATGIELIHMATLLHDDIIDESPVRRRHTSAYKRFGIAPTLLTGDFLLVRAFGLCAQLGPFIVQETERACVKLTEGEVLEGTIAGAYSGSFEQYVDIINKKTASLFELACVSGAHFAGATPQQVNLLRSFGKNAGIAFQMVDDILDITADEDLLGKPSGTDLKQKTPSLVNIIWLESGDPRAEEFFLIPQPTVDEAKDALQHILNTDIVARCCEHAKSFATTANSALHELPAQAISKRTRDHLTAIVEYTLARCL